MPVDAGKVWLVGGVGRKEGRPVVGISAGAGCRQRTSWIEVDALRLRCVIGCRQDERRDRSDVVIDLLVAVDAEPAGASDKPADAWDYRTPVKAVIADVEASGSRTVEALRRPSPAFSSWTMARGAHSTRAKPGALRFCESAGTVIERSAAEFAPGVSP